MLYRWSKARLFPGTPTQDKACRSILPARPQSTVVGLGRFATLEEKKGTRKTFPCCSAPAKVRNHHGRGTAIPRSATLPAAVSPRCIFRATHFGCGCPPSLDSVFRDLIQAAKASGSKANSPVGRVRQGISPWRARRTTLAVGRESHRATSWAVSSGGGRSFRPLLEAGGIRFRSGLEPFS